MLNLILCSHEISSKFPWDFVANLKIWFLSKLKLAVISWFEAKFQSNKNFVKATFHDQSALSSKNSKKRRFKGTKIQSNKVTYSYSVRRHVFCESYLSLSTEHESDCKVGEKKKKDLWTSLEKRTLFSLLPHDLIFITSTQELPRVY